MRPFGPLQLLGVILVVALASALVAPRPTRAGEPGTPVIPPGIRQAADLCRQELEGSEPELVFLGNSILEAAVDPAQLEQLTGLSCFNLMIHGSASALWYACLKGAVLAQGHRPKYVAILFRDIILTYPTYRTDPRYHPWLEYFAFGDPLLEELVFDPPTDPLTDLMRDHWSLYQEHVEIRERVEYQAREGLLGGLFGVEPSRLHSALESTFATDRLVPELATEEEEAAGTSSPHLPFYDFDRNIDRSFLPAMIEMTEAAGVKLVLVRMRSRRDVLSESDPDGIPEHLEKRLPVYLEKLRAYLAERQVTFIDMTEEGAIQLEHYAIGDHLKLEGGQPLFTRLLARRLKEAGVAGPRGAPGARTAEGGR